MKKLILFVACMAVMTAYAQNSGLGFNYQAVVRNANGVLLADTTVNLRVSLFPGQEASTPTWVEIQNPRTDMSGSFAINVGNDCYRNPSSVVANYSDVNFASIHYWLKVEVLEDNTYREVSFSRLPSSPYAEVAYNAVLYPAGMISPFAGPVETIPYGWMLCDGSEVSRTEYANLYDVIGVCWGVGDGSTTFNLPDLRGMFLRGVSGESENDPDAENRVVLSDNGGNTGNQVGSYQGDAIRNITGEQAYLAWATHNNGVGHAGTGAFANSTSSGGDGANTGDQFNTAKVVFDASCVVPVGGDNRPKNVYVNYIIKF